MPKQTMFDMCQRCGRIEATHIITFTTHQMHYCEECYQFVNSVRKQVELVDTLYKSGTLFTPGPTSLSPRVDERQEAEQVLVAPWRYTQNRIK